MPQVIIPWVIGGLVAFISFVIALLKTKKKLKGKKVMLFGPQESGKTTFVNWLIKEEQTTEHIATATGESHSYHDSENNTDYEFFDMGGAKEFLIGGVMQKKYEENDFIFMFFDVKRYTSDKKNGAYRSDVNARFEALARLFKSKQKPILFIGSHSDKLDKDKQKSFRYNLQNLVESSKDYYSFLCGQKFLLANLTSKNDVKVILNEITKLK